MQSEENKISSNCVRQLSSITLEEAIRILKPDYMFFNTGNWHLEDCSEELGEPCKKLYCNTKTFQFWFFNNKIDIQLVDDTFGIDLTQDINFDVKYGCYIRAVQCGFYVPSLSEFKFGYGYGQTQFVNELRDFSLDSLLSKFKNGHELFNTDAIFKAGIMQILSSQNIKPNNPENVKFDVYDLYIEKYKILYDNWRKNLNNIVLIGKSSKILIKDMNYVVFDGTSHYVCDSQELENLKESKILFEICFENVDIDICQSEADRLNDLA